MDRTVTAGPTAIDSARGSRSSPLPRNYAARLFGYDLFISFALGPPPRGSHRYAADLARRMRERDFSVFFSEDEAPPGEQLDSTLLTALKRSRALVVVANRGTLESPRWVKTEVEEFRRLNPDCPVIPISVGGALQDEKLAVEVEPWLGFQGKIWLDEMEDAMATGIAGDTVVERLATAPTRSRSNVKWRWVVRSVVASLAALAVALGIATKVARDSAERARSELRTSTAQRLAEGAPVMIKGDRVGGAERALQQLLAAHKLAPSSLAVDAHMQTLVTSLSNVAKLVDTGSTVRSLTFSADGAQILSDHEDGKLRRWDAGSGAPVGAASNRHTKEESRYVTSAFSADSRFIIDGDLGGSLTLRDLASGKPLASTAEAHKTRSRPPSPAIAFSRDGKYVVSGSFDGLRLWNAMTLRAIGPRQDAAHEGAIQAVAFSSDGNFIASGGAQERAFLGAPEDASNQKLRLWNAHTLKPIAAFDGQAGDIMSVAFSPDGSQLVSGGADGMLRLWNVSSRQPVGLPLVTGFKDGIRSVAFSPDGKRIALGGADGVLATVNAGTPSPLGAPLPTPKPAFSEYVDAVMISHDGSLIAAADQKGKVLLWDAKTARPIGEFNGTPLTPWGGLPAGEIPGLAISRDGAMIATSGVNGPLLWNAKTLQPIDLAMKGHQVKVASLAFSPDGKQLVSGNTDGSLLLWNLSDRTSQPINAAGTARAQAVTSLAFSPDGLRFVAARAGGLLELRDAKTWGLISSAQMQGQNLDVSRARLRVAFSQPDGTRIVSELASDANQVATQVWDGGNLKAVGPAIQTRKEGYVGVNSVAFSPNASLVAWGLVNGTLLLWDTQTGKPVGNPIKGHEHESAIQSLAFSPDGTYLVSGGDDGTLRLWDVSSRDSTGEPIGAPFRVHKGESGVRSLAFSADGSRIVSGVDQTVRLWPGRAAWAGALCARLTRNMSRQQWQAGVSGEIDYLPQCPGLPVPG